MFIRRADGAVLLSLLNPAFVMVSCRVLVVTYGLMWCGLRLIKGRLD